MEKDSVSDTEDQSMVKDEPGDLETSKEKSLDDLMAKMKKEKSKYVRIKKLF
jgi:hypothetical protein